MAPNRASSARIAGVGAPVRSTLTAREADAAENAGAPPAATGGHGITGAGAEGERAECAREDHPCFIPCTWIGADAGGYGAVPP
jgi:hypothetical protein